MTTIAAFVSPHGFGHAARASAVLAEIDRTAEAAFELFTTAPRWFFEESLSGRWRLHEVAVDVGFRQASALDIDLEATVAALDAFVPFDEALVARLADRVRALGCSCVLCDIAPLGVAVAEAAGLPSVLVENFSWSWLYEPYLRDAPGLGPVSSVLDEWTGRATVHLQARPMCLRVPGTEAVNPIGRAPRRERAEVRTALGIDPEATLVVVTMGGYAEAMPSLDRMRDRADVTFLLTGGGASGVHGNVHVFDNNTPLFMPDVLRSAEAVVAKLGYGTVSEVWREGLPFAGVTRPGFREMASLEAFAEEELTGFVLSADDYRAGRWIDRLDELLALPRTPASEPGGARRVAEVVLDAGRVSSR